MKLLYLFISFYLLNFFTFAPYSAEGQTLLEGFEDWETIDNYESPIAWETNQDDMNERIEKSDDSYDGNHALKLVPDSPNSAPGHTCQSIVSRGFSLDQVYDGDYSLNYYIKSEALNDMDTAFFRAKIEFFGGGSRWQLKYESYNVVAEEYTLIEIPFPSQGVDSIQLQYDGAALVGSNGFGCRHLSNIWIDNIHIAEATSSIGFAEANDVSVYPNPASGIVNLDQTETKFERFKVYDALGQLVNQGEVRNSRINLTTNGLNLIVLFDREGEIYRTKVLNTSN